MSEEEALAVVTQRNWVIATMRPDLMEDASAREVM
jgi:hypothetical protein